MRRFFFATAVIGIAMGAHAVQAAPVITTYGTGADFAAANPGATFENFGTQVSPQLIASKTTYDYGGFTIAQEYNNTGVSVGLGSFVGRWRGKPPSTQADVITFDVPLVAWGATFDTQDGGNGVGHEVRIVVGFGSGAQQILIGSVGAGTNPNIAFLGFVSDTPFETLRITSVAPGRDTYSLYGMSYVATGGAPDPSTDVPVPASLALFAAGLLGLGTLRRSRGSA